jgi:hypothetical protein
MAPADPQLASPFFTLLPAEIRNLIYAEFWCLASPRHHVLADQVRDDQAGAGVPTERWAHIPCITHPDTLDVRFQMFLETHPSSPARDVWGSRLKSEWCRHWACEEQGQNAFEFARKSVRARAPPEGEPWAAAESARQAEREQTEEWEDPSALPAKTRFMSVLTACKRM